MSFDSTEELSDLEVLSIIRSIAETGTLIFSDHARERMEDRGYTADDVIHILLHGSIKEKEFKETNNNWVYTIEGDDLDDDRGWIIIAIIQLTKGIVITVLS